MALPRFGSFYRLDPQTQKRAAFRRLLRYLRSVVEPYHPYLRERYKAEGVRLDRIKDYADFTRLPVITKEEYRKDTRAFILQPKIPGAEAMIPYDTASLSLSFLARYFAQAVLNRPREFGHLFRKMAFLEGRVGRRIGMEWMPIHFHVSGGSTGEPTPVVYTYHDFRTVVPEVASTILLEPDEPDPEKPRFEWSNRHMNLFPGAPHLAFFQAVITKMATGLSCFDTFGGQVIPTERQVQVFSEGKFNALNAIPSYLTYWMRKAVEMVQDGRISPMPHFTKVVVAGEPTSDSLKTFFKDMARKLGAHPKFEVTEGYGMTEIKWAFMECCEGSKIHLNPKFWFWEVLDPKTYEPVGEGEEGVLVFSHIGWRGTVFIRYDTGDLIRGGVVWDRCRFCGYSFPRLIGPIARAKKDFSKIKGARVALLELVETVRDTPGVRGFQIILDKEIEGDERSRDVLRIRVAPHPGTDRDDLSARLKARVKAASEVRPDAILFEDDHGKLEADLFQRTKVKADYIVDRRPLHL